MVVQGSTLKLFQKVKYQFLAGFCVNLISLAHGTALGWLSPAVPLLLSQNSPLRSGPLSIEEISWLGAVISFGAIAGNFIFGIISVKTSRKLSILLLAFPNMAFWFWVYYSDNLSGLFFGRLCSGLTGGGIFIAIQIYIAEIADNNIRGALSSLVMITINIGILIGFLAGTYLPYRTVPLVMLAFPTIFLCAGFLLPDTPQSLLRHGNLEKAKRSLKFYKNYDSMDTPAFNKELAALQLVKNTGKENPRESIKLFATNPSIRKIFFKAMGLVIINQGTGGFVMINYTASIFESSGSDFDPHMSSIILAIMQILGIIISCLMVDHFGRKTILVISCVASMLAQTGVGAYSYLIKSGMDLSAFNWIPVTLLSIVIFVTSLGIFPLPMVIISEILPVQVRTTGMMICMFFLSVIAFIMLKFYPILSVVLEFHGCLWIFSSIALLSAIFVIFWVPETKGLNINTMEQQEQPKSKEVIHAYA